MWIHLHWEQIRIPWMFFQAGPAPTRHHHWPRHDTFGTSEFNNLKANRSSFSSRTLKISKVQDPNWPHPGIFSIPIIIIIIIVIVIGVVGIALVARNVITKLKWRRRRSRSRSSRQTTPLSSGSSRCAHCSICFGAYDECQTQSAKVLALLWEWVQKDDYV